MRRLFTDAGIPAEMTIGELEDQMGRILRGKKSVLPLEVFQELTGLARMDEWAEAVIIDMVEGFGFADAGDGLFYRIEKPRLTDGLTGKGLWN